MMTRQPQITRCRASQLCVSSYDRNKLSEGKAYSSSSPLAHSRIERQSRKFNKLWVHQREDEAKAESLMALSHLVRGDAILFAYTPTDLRLPDLGRYQKMTSSSWHLHMFRAKDGYAACHSGCISGDAWEAESHHARPGDIWTFRNGAQFLQERVAPSL